MQFKKNKFIVSFVISFGTFSFPMHRVRQKKSRYSLKRYCVSIIFEQNILKALYEAKHLREYENYKFAYFV